ncbi:hypothetical protein FSARC_2819 [Fusarium sarcochroum]|uniref:Amidase domain-containing protein n=1 Tax=Fusarium sarcochroum TaxID=1208366 RepID=A0A8H4U5W5_9HYPO|nr:hypothetical protein FSARC_2819 [Fusarium sarcochroum]
MTPIADSGVQNAFLFAPAHELQAKLEAEEITSVELVGLFLEQIERHNYRFNAVISTAPSEIAIARAEELDKERKAGQVRGKLHGIPVIVKDAVVTDASLGMITTAGSHAIATLKAKRNASCITKMLEAGMVILGKGNMTEFCGLKSNNTPVGWSAYGSQTLSPYRRDDLEEEHQPTAGGSSSGPAVSILAGFSPLGIATETTGSTVYPSSTNGLYGMKPSPDSIDNDGLWKLSDSFDGVGVMARDPTDLAALIELLLKPEVLAKLPEGGHEASLKKNWQGLRIGMVDINWGSPGEASKSKWSRSDVKASYEQAAKKIGELADKVIYPLDIPQADVLTYNGRDLGKIAYYEYSEEIRKFLLNFHPDSKVDSLKGLVEWNKEHADIELPEPYNTQTELIACLEPNMTAKEHTETLAALRRLATTDGMGKWMDDHDIDIILSNSDSTLVTFAACAKWPIGTVPLGNAAKNDQPFGLFALAREGREDILLHFMSAFHATFTGPKPPSIK